MCTDWNLCLTRNFKVYRGGSNIYSFHWLCKALTSLLIICPKKFLQESINHPFNNQTPEATLQAATTLGAMATKSSSLTTSLWTRVANLATKELSDQKLNRPHFKDEARLQNTQPTKYLT